MAGEEHHRARLVKTINVRMRRVAAGETTIGYARTEG